MRNIKFFKFIVLFFSAMAFTSSAWSFHNHSLSGEWFHDGHSTSIRKQGLNSEGLEQYLFCNENGECATGSLTSDYNVQVLQWSVVGFINRHYTRINWSNGSQWVRDSSSEIDIDGKWYHSDQPTYIQVNGDNRNFLLTNEAGQRSWGYIQGRILTIPSLNIRGYITREGNQINWSNHTVWIR